MISWAGHGEDQVLRRFLVNRASGTYVDIGAAHPKFGSVTYALYGLGWRGIAIEPRKEVCRLWSKLRPEDLLVSSALTVEGGDGFMSAEGFRSHFSSQKNLIAGKSYLPAESISTAQLKALMKQTLLSPPTFIKVDIEGQESEIVNSLLSMNVLPELWLIEVVDQFGSEHFRRESSRNMKILLQSFDYQMALFDGVNEWYVHKSSEALQRSIWAPAYPGVEDFIPFHLTINYRLRNFIHFHRYKIVLIIKKIAKKALQKK